MMFEITAGSTDITIFFWVRDTSSGVGAGLTGLAYDTSGLTCYYERDGVAATQLTLASQTVTGSHSDGGFVQIDSTNMPGLYRLDLSDAIVAAGAERANVYLKGAANMAQTTFEVVITTGAQPDAPPHNRTPWIVVYPAPSGLYDI